MKYEHWEVTKEVVVVCLSSTQKVLKTPGEVQYGWNIIGSKIVEYLNKCRVVQ